MASRSRFQRNGGEMLDPTTGARNRRHSLTACTSCRISAHPSTMLWSKSWPPSPGGSVSPHTKRPNIQKPRRFPTYPSTSIHRQNYLRRQRLTFSSILRLDKGHLPLHDEICLIIRSAGNQPHDYDPHPFRAMNCLSKYNARLIISRRQINRSLYIDLQHHNR